MIETGSGALYYDLCDVVPAWVDNAQTIVFHHGIAANTHIWAEWLPVLATRYRLLRFDMRGFGKSVQPPREFFWSFEGLVDDLLKVADAAGAERFHLVGESIGGTVALACALAAPQRLLSLTLSNAAARGGLVANVQGWREILAQEGQRGWAKQLMDSRFHHGALDPGLYAWYLRVHETCSMDAAISLTPDTSSSVADATASAWAETSVSDPAIVSRSASALSSDFACAAAPSQTSSATLAMPFADAVSCAV